MPRGASPRREREYRELEHKFEKSGRYGNRAKEVAARIVNKQRARYGETKGEKQKDHEGKSPDRDLSVNNYQHLTVPQVVSKLDGLSKSGLGKIEKYEKAHKNRKGVVQELEKRRSGGR